MSRCRQLASRQPHTETELPIRYEIHGDRRWDLLLLIAAQGDGAADEEFGDFHGRAKTPLSFANIRVSFWLRGLVYGKSIAGLRPKNPHGTRRKPARCTGITGQSSGRGLCVMPIVYHSTTS